MAEEIRGISATCLNKQHKVCIYRNCDCRCHREPTLAEKIADLAQSPLPDNQRLQVLIQLAAELAEKVR